MNKNNNIAAATTPPLWRYGETNIRAIIFDFDGTLLDSIADIAQAVNKVLQADGLPTHSVEKYVEFIGNGARKLVELALPEKWRTDNSKIDYFLAAYKKEYKANIVDKSKLFNGIPALLSFFNKKKLPIAINTNKPHDQTMLIVEKLLSEFHFEIIQGQVNSVPRKPNPAGALKIAEKMEIAPSEILYVGDSIVDVKTATAAKMQITCVEWGYGSKQEMLDAGCENFISSPEELISLNSLKRT